ncbi:MAG: amino acid ABC transporter substrate-binding protein, partial [Cohaesibacteraceae bacterium]|nr:amino acid ABC transporter substrate-binding protein [Cohaesibacteraceae bacterium]
MTITRRRNFLRMMGLATSVAALSIIPSQVASAKDRISIKIGYAVSKTGQNSAGAGITTIPNYELWVKDVNDSGGLLLPDGSRLPIEIVEYDDRSSTEEVVRAISRLATQDKVDFILPPWGTGFNLAIAPLMDRLGYPQLAVTAITDKAPEFAKRWNKSFWFLGGGSDYAEALVEVLAAAHKDGKINNKVALVSVADGFGIDLRAAAAPSFKSNGFELTFNKTYPLGTSDFAAIMNEVQGSGADSFIAFSYPPGTFSITKQAQVMGYNPKIFSPGVGVGFPIFSKINGDNVEGIMSLGGVDIHNAKISAYAARHQTTTGRSPDTWASAVTYASLEILQQAIARKGLDREDVSTEISTGSFDTILGPIKLENNQLRNLWWIGQWQKG